jgi:hypothetical protein
MDGMQEELLLLEEEETRKGATRKTMRGVSKVERMDDGDVKSERWRGCS